MTNTTPASTLVIYDESGIGNNFDCQDFDPGRLNNPFKVRNPGNILNETTFWEGYIRAEGMQLMQLTLNSSPFLKRKLEEAGISFAEKRLPATSFFRIQNIMDTWIEKAEDYGRNKSLIHKLFHFPDTRINPKTRDERIRFLAETNGDVNEYLQDLAEGLIINLGELEHDPNYNVSF